MTRDRKNSPITRWDDVPLLIDIPFAARLLGKTREHLSRRCSNGSFPAFKDGKEWRIHKEDLIRYIHDNANKEMRRLDSLPKKELTP